MKIKDRKVVALKRKLKLAGVKGLALDIDETLSFTIEYIVGKLSEKFGNPENLNAREIFLKYRHTGSVPYWQGEEVEKFVGEINNSNEIQKNLPLIEDSDKIVQEINKIIPIVAYVTARPGTVLDGTKFWLKKHGFPKAEIITKPNNIHRKKGNEWKAKVLKYLYPQIIGIVDDNPGLTRCFSKNYKGIIYLYDTIEAERKDIKVVACKDWETVAKKIKKNRL